MALPPPFPLLGSGLIRGNFEMDFTIYSNYISRGISVCVCFFFVLLEALEWRPSSAFPFEKLKFKKFLNYLDTY